MIVVYTRRGLKDWQAGRAIGPIIIIDPAYRDDAGLLAHERVHVAQWWRVGALTTVLMLCVAIGLGVVPGVMGLSIAGFGMHPLLYSIDEAYRLDAEVEAYREQAKHYPDDRRRQFAHFIATRYGITLPEGSIVGLMLA